MLMFFQKNEVCILKKTSPKQGQNGNLRPKQDQKIINF